MSRVFSAVFTKKAAGKSQEERGRSSEFVKKDLDSILSSLGGDAQEDPKLREDLTKRKRAPSRIFNRSFSRKSLRGKPTSGDASAWEQMGASTSEAIVPIPEYPLPPVEVPENPQDNKEQVDDGAQDFEDEFDRLLDEYESEVHASVTSKPLEEPTDQQYNDRDLAFIQEPPSPAPQEEHPPADEVRAADLPEEQKEESWSASRVIQQLQQIEIESQQRKEHQVASISRLRPRDGLVVTSPRTYEPNPLFGQVVAPQNGITPVLSPHTHHSPSRKGHDRWPFVPESELPAPRLYQGRGKCYFASAGTFVRGLVGCVSNEM